EAARAYRALLLLTEVPEQTRARALLGLAQAYEARGLSGAAWQIYARAQGRYGSLHLDEDGRTVQDVVDDRFAAAPFRDLETLVGEPSLTLPLDRSWTSRRDE